MEINRQRFGSSLEPQDRRLMQEVWRSENAIRGLREVIAAAPIDMDPHSETAHMVRIAQKALYEDGRICDENPF